MLQTTKKIVVLGAGSWGSALAIALAKGGHDVTLWGRSDEVITSLNSTRYHPKCLPDIQFPSMRFTTDLGSAIKDKAMIVIAVPSHAVTALLSQLTEYLDMYALGCLPWFVLACKGLAKDAQGEKTRLMHDLFAQSLGSLTHFAILSGPTFAVEVAQGLPAMATLATHYSASASDVEQLKRDVECADIQVDLTTDLMGVEIAGIVKNVLAIATGISDGLMMGKNSRASLIVQGLQEMNALIMAMRGSSDTLFKAAGIGDLLLTTTSDQSRNYRYGFALGKNTPKAEIIAQIGEVVEGARNATALTKLSQKLAIQMPICCWVAELLRENSVVPIEDLRVGLFNLFSGSR